MTLNYYPNISIVVIGLNEEANLVNTFKAIENLNYPKEKIEILYVDSGSSDKSVEIAKRYTDKIFIENHFYPTAARGRNRGLKESKYDIVHFIDGDVKIAPDYLSEAVKILSENKAQAVHGKIIENSKGIFNKIMEISWHKNIAGYVNSTAAGGTYLKASLNSVNGYDSRIKLGEETELGVRFTTRGYKIYYTNSVMGYHSNKLSSFTGFIKRIINIGNSFSELAVIKGNNLFFINSRRVYRNTIIINCILIILIVIAVLINDFLILLYLPCIYFIYLIYKYRHLFFNKNYPKLFYFILMNFLKPVHFTGIIEFKIRILFDKKLKNYLRNGII